MSSYIVEVTHEWRPYDDMDEMFRVDTPEEAAQIYESEAITCNQPLSQIVEELAWEGLRLESLCTETGKLVVAYEAEPAGVS
jgi:hypothetical protein